MNLPKFNLKSPKHLSLLLFGGELDVVVKEPVLLPDGRFDLVKSGENKDKIKVRNVTKTIRIKGLGLHPLDSWKTKTEGVYQTNKDVLEFISGESDD